MSAEQPRVPPRFVPTLTEVVDDLPAAGAARPSAGAVVASGGWVTPQMQEAMVQRVLRRVGESLEPQLGDAVAAIAQQHAEALVQHLQEKIEDIVTELVADAVAAEVNASRHSRQPG
jgi:histone H3/H4